MMEGGKEVYRTFVPFPAATSLSPAAPSTHHARFCKKPNGKISVSIYCQSIKEQDLCTCYSNPWGHSFQPLFK